VTSPFPTIPQAGDLGLLLSGRKSRKRSYSGQAVLVVPLRWDVML